MMYTYIIGGCDIVIRSVTNAGILAYLGFSPYKDQGESLWDEPLNYYLIPVMVSPGQSTELCSLVLAF